MSNVKFKGGIHLKWDKASYESKTRPRGQEHLASCDLKVDLCQNFDLALSGILLQRPVSRIVLILETSEWSQNTRMDALSKDQMFDFHYLASVSVKPEVRL